MRSLVNPNNNGESSQENGDNSAENIEFDDEFREDGKNIYFNLIQFILCLKMVLYFIFLHIYTFKFMVLFCQKDYFLF